MPSKPRVDEELQQRAHRLSLGRNTPKAGRALGELGPRAIPELEKALRHENPFVRSGAVHGLAAVAARGGDVAGIIAGALANDRDPRVRETACHVLGELGADAVRATRSALEDATNDRDQKVAVAAADALKKGA